MPSSKQPVRRRKRRLTMTSRLCQHVGKLILSPVVILWDIFRRQGRLDNSWIYSLLLVITFLFGLAFASLIVVEGSVDRTLHILANSNRDPEILSGDVQPIIGYINKYALEYQIDPHLIFAIIKTESNFNPKARSSSGARGLMQIMPLVWRKYCNPEWPEDSIYDPELNIQVGVRYFRSLLDRYHGRIDLALEAYNAGLSNVKPGKEPKYAETRNYLQKTVSYWQELRNHLLSARLELALTHKMNFKRFFGVSFFLWLIFFWWANRKLLGNDQ